MLPHRQAVRPGNMLSVNQEIPDELVQADQAVLCPLLAGWMSVSLFIYFLLLLGLVHVFELLNESFLIFLGPRRTARPCQRNKCVWEEALWLCDPLRPHLCIPRRRETHTNMCILMLWCSSDFTLLAFSLLPLGSRSSQEIWRNEPGVWNRSLQSLFEKRSINIRFLRSYT